VPRVLRRSYPLALLAGGGDAAWVHRLRTLLPGASSAQCRSYGLLQPLGSADARPLTRSFWHPPTALQYLTFCGFTAQLLLWPFALAADLARAQTLA
jgi:hypothetical protein